MFWRRPKAPEVILLTDDLAIGPQPEDQDWPAIRKLGFRGVVDLREEGRDLGATVRAHDLSYMRAPIIDSAAPDVNELYEVTGWITAHILNEGPVFVYCSAGRGRSAMVAIACLVRLGLPVSEAYGILLRNQPAATISSKQMKALEAFTNSLQAKAA